ncbi:MAG: M14 family metallopeptidase [Bacteriovoracaceae bacterium]
MSLKKLLMVSIIISSNAIAESRMIVRFDLTPQIREFLRENEFDITGVNYKENHIEALLTESELAQIQSQKTSVQFAFPQTVAGGPDEEYKTPEEIEDFVRDINNRYPTITKLVSIGKSLEGRDIWAIKISDNVEKDEVEPVVLVNGMHHAREVMTPEITTDMVEYLTSNYGKDANVTKWVNSYEVWIVPMFNVDGNHKMWTEDGWWRKNNRGGYGVDINRNYPTAWNTCQGSSSSKDAQDYRGAAAGSEPETQAMMNLVASIRPVFDISYHSYSEIVIYPFGCKPKRTPATEAVEEIGAEIGKTLDYKPGTSWELLYNVDGGDIDWMYTEHQVIPFVIEVNSSWEGFFPNYRKTRDKTVLRNRRGWMHLFTRLEGPSFQGSVKGNDFNRIRVTLSKDKSAVTNYKINPDGSFYIILKAGTYDFAFEGTKSKEVKNIEVRSKVVLSL